MNTQNAKFLFDRSQDIFNEVIKQIEEVNKKAVGLLYLIASLLLGALTFICILVDVTKESIPFELIVITSLSIIGAFMTLIILKPAGYRFLILIARMSSKTTLQVII